MAITDSEIEWGGPAWDARDRSPVHTHHEGPLCPLGWIDGEPNDAHGSCLELANEICYACEIEQAHRDAEGLVYCTNHGYVMVVDEGKYTGYAGGPCYWADLSCGCGLVNEDADIAAAV